MTFLDGNLDSIFSAIHQDAELSDDTGESSCLI